MIAMSRYVVAKKNQPFFLLIFTPFIRVSITCTSSSYFISIFFIIHMVTNIRQLILFFFYIQLLFSFQKSTRNPYVDIFVAIITVPTLILLALLLDANIQTDRETTDEARSSFIVLIFGFAFLVLSSLVCGCIVHKMGMCHWDRRHYDDEVITSNRNDNLECIHVIDLPPSYDTVTKHGNNLACLKPPPTYEMACSTEKLAQSSSTATINHI